MKTLKFNKTVVTMMMALFTALFIMAAVPVKSVKAAELSPSESASIIVQNTDKLIMPHSSNTSTGVTDVDNSLSNFKTFIVGVVRFIGAIVAVIGLVLGIVGMFFTKSPEQRLEGITFFIGGLVIFFAPSIVNFVTGSTLF